MQNHIFLSKLDCILEKSFHLQRSFRALQNSSKEVVQTCTARLEFVFSSVLINMTTIMEHSNAQFCQKKLIVKVSKSRKHFFLKLHCTSKEQNIWQNLRFTYLYRRWLDHERSKINKIWFSKSIFNVKNHSGNYCLKY